MKRSLLSTMILLSAAIGLAHAIPARPLYIPPDPPRPPVIQPPVHIGLAGTAWNGKYFTTNRTFIFEVDGTVSYRNPTSKILYKNRGNWRLEGNTLIFTHFTMEFRGQVKDPNTIVGESSMKAGAKTTQTLQRTTFDK